MVERVTPDPRTKEILGKHTRLLDPLTDLLNRSFDAEDLTVLRRALEGDVQANIDMIDQIIAHLVRLRKALAAVEATQLLMGGNG